MISTRCDGGRMSAIGGGGGSGAVVSDTVGLAVRGHAATSGRTIMLSAPDDARPTHLVDSPAMTLEDPSGPLVLCFDDSEAAERAIRVAPVIVGPGRTARVLYTYKPTERSLGVAQAVTGGRIDAPVSGEADAHDVVDRGVAIAREAGFEAEALLVVADRPTGELIAATAEELDAPAIVMGQRGLSGLKSALLGSVSRDVVNAYHRPVILV
jgi:nucleotide-binding universal stress UspA family protein